MSVDKTVKGLFRALGSVTLTSYKWTFMAPENRSKDCNSMLRQRKASSQCVCSVFTPFLFVSFLFPLSKHLWLKGLSFALYFLGKLTLRCKVWQCSLTWHLLRSVMRDISGDVDSCGWVSLLRLTRVMLSQLKCVIKWVFLYRISVCGWWKVQGWPCRLESCPGPCAPNTCWWMERKSCLGLTGENCL